MSNNKFTMTLDFGRKCIKKAETIEKAAKMMCGYSYSDSHGVSREDIIKYMQLGAEWKEKQMIKDAVDAVDIVVDYPLIGYYFPNIYPNYKELKDYCDKHSIKDNDKVKLIIIKEE